VAHDPPAFRIDRTEVTAGNYALCLGAGACGGEDLLLHDGEAGAQCNVGAAGKERHPANCVSRAGGERYCSWVGGRLPSEDEWEQAARGQEERAYPWGEEFVPFRANCDEAACGDGFFFSAPVGMFPAGASPYGPLDLAGNVMEWTASTPTAAIGYVTAEVNRDGDPYFVLKGGSWKSFGLSMKSTEMDFYAAHTMLPEAGFRCAYDVHGEVAQ
jgi:formylglycine-generating enzyme required for sulfatase activity